MGRGVEEEEKKKTKDIEEVEEMVLEAPVVVVTSRKKVRNKRSWLRGSAVEEEASNVFISFSSAGMMKTSSLRRPRLKRRVERNHSITTSKRVSGDYESETEITRGRRKGQTERDFESSK